MPGRAGWRRSRRSFSTDHMIILGINAYHGDVSAVLVRDGELVAAVEEERYRRIKHLAGFPDAGDSSVPRDGRRLGARRRRLRGLAQSARESVAEGDVRPAPASARRDDVGSRGELPRSAPSPTRWRRRSASTAAHVRARLHWVEHHPAHLASTLLRLAVRRCRRVRDRRVRRLRQHVASRAGPGTTLDVLDRMFFPHSLGLFYLAITQYLGFPQVRRRVQGDGARAVRAAAPRRAASASWSTCCRAAASS